VSPEARLSVIVPTRKRMGFCDRLASRSRELRPCDDHDPRSLTA
jgi:hypothetical protein